MVALDCRLQIEGDPQEHRFDSMKAPNPHRSTPFDFGAIDHSDGEPHDNVGPSVEEATHRVMELLNKLIFGPTGGGPARAPSARSIAARWTVIRVLLGLDADKSLRQCARELGVTAASLSKLGIRFAAALNVSPPWQRSIDVRAAYSKRQREVAAGVHVITPEHERRLVREKRQQDNPPIKADATL